MFIFTMFQESGTTETPGYGNVDFNSIFKDMDKNIIYILEVHPPSNAEDIKQGCEILAQAGLKNRLYPEEK